MAEKEAAITNALRIKASHLGARLFRVNTGVGWIGKIIRKTGDTITISAPRALHAGLCKGGSDVIGWQSVTVTPEMVGTKVALFVAIELKTGKVATTEEQRAFVAAVASAGGISGVARSVDEAVALLR